MFNVKRVITYFILLIALIFSLFNYNSILRLFDYELVKSDNYEKLVNKIANNNKIIDDLNNQIENNNSQLEIFNVLINSLPSNELINSLPTKLDQLPIQHYQTRKLKLLNKEYELSEYKISYLNIEKHPGAVASAYIEQQDNNLIIMSGNGYLFYIGINDLINHDKINKLIKIPTNIKEIVKFDEFYNDSSYGIKDIFVNDYKIYISYTNELYKDCYNIAVLESDLSFNQVEFKKIFNPDECVKVKNSYGEFNPHVSGGRIVTYSENNLLLSVGGFRYRDLAQNKKSVFGKIISFDLKSNNYKIKSLGHRNVQGLLYNKDFNYILATEHGPLGGDEINLNNNLDEINNFGWPIVSYGEHYGEYSAAKYIKAPLKKPHNKYGFTEPLNYFTPSIGISEIIEVNEKFNGIKNKQVFVGAMGKNKDGARSLHHIVYDDSFKKLESAYIRIDRRIRDMIYDNNKNVIYLFFENIPSVGILKAVSEK